MLVCRAIITSANRQSFVYGNLIRQFSYDRLSSPSHSPKYDDDDKPKKPERKLREWRRKLVIQESNLKAFETPERKGKKLILPRQYFRLPQMELKRWWNMQRTNFWKYDQRFIALRHETLGCDLAAAHFLVHRGGKVKCYGQTDWIAKNSDGLYDLPKFYEQAWQLTHIDASGVELYYEGFENFKNLHRVSWANFSKNPNFNDWCMDKISAEFRNIEYLDVSECKNVTERGLEAVCRLYILKTLIITDWERKPSFELSCAMLEDSNPNISIVIKKPEEIIEKKAV